MRFPYWFRAVLGAVFLISACQPRGEEVSAPEEEAAPSDEEQIDAQTTAFTEAWNRGDAAALAALFTEDGTSVDPAGQAFEGRAAVQGRYEELFGGMYQGTTLTVHQSSVEFPREDVALTIGSFEIAGVRVAEGEATTIEGRYLNVVVREDGEWRIAASRPMIPTEVPAAPAS